MTTGSVHYGVARFPLFRGFLLIAVYEETIVSIRSVRFIAGVRYSGVFAKRGSTVNTKSLNISTALCSKVTAAVAIGSTRAFARAGTAQRIWIQPTPPCTSVS